MKNEFFICFSIWLGTVALIILAFGIFGEWRDHNPITFCDEIENSKVDEYNTRVCKLRYPILNTEEIKTLKEKNEELETEITSLKIKIENINKAINDEIDDDWEPDPPERDF